VRRYFAFAPGPCDFDRPHESIDFDFARCARAARQEVRGESRWRPTSPRRGLNNFARPKTGTVFFRFHRPQGRPGPRNEQAIHSVLCRPSGASDVSCIFPRLPLGYVQCRSRKEKANLRYQHAVGVEIFSAVCKEHFQGAPCRVSHARLDLRSA